MSNRNSVMKPSSMKNIDIEGSESFCEENSLAEENYNDDGDNEDEEDMFGDETPNAGNTGTSSKRTTMAIRMARPSSIVQYHLQSMKKSLVRLEAEIAHPSWLDALLEEINKIPGLIRKIEHCQMDINGIRMLIYTGDGKKVLQSNSNEMIQDQNALIAVAGQVLDPLQRVVQELEEMRLIVRRIDVHHALEATMFSKVQELQKNVKILLQLKGSAETIKKMRVAQESLVMNVKIHAKKLEDLEKSNAEFQESSNQKFIDLETKTSAVTQDLNSLVSTKLNELNDLLKCNITEKQSEMEHSINGMRFIIDRLTKIALKLPIESGSLKILRWYYKNKHQTCSSAFRKWQEYDPKGHLALSRRFLALCGSARFRGKKMQMFYIWKNAYENYMRKMTFLNNLTHVFRVVAAKLNPTPHKYFQIWKKNYLLEKYAEVKNLAFLPADSIIDDRTQQNGRVHTMAIKEVVERPSSGRGGQMPALSGPHNNMSGNSNISSSGGAGSKNLPSRDENVSVPRTMLGATKHLVSVQDFSDLIERIDTKKDIEGCFELVGVHLQNQSIQSEQLHNEVLNSQRDMQRVETLVEKARVDLNHQSVARSESIESAHNYFKNAITEQVSRFRADFTQKNENLELSQQKHDENLEQIKDLVTNMNLRMNAQDEKIERLFVLHGAMLERMDEIKTVQDKEVDKLNALSDGFYLLKAEKEREYKEFQQNKQVVEDNLVHVNAEVQSLREQTKQAMMEVGKVLKSQLEHHKKMNLEQAEIQSKVQYMEEWLEKTAPLPPTADAIVNVCLAYEDKAFDLFGKESHYLIFTKEMAQNLSQYAQALATHVARTVDEDVLRSVLSGSQSLRIKLDKSQPTTSFAEAYHIADMDDSTQGEVVLHDVPHEDYCSYMREQMLLKFFEEFHLSIEALRPNGGVVRNEARIIFLQRFVDAVDMALSKLDTITLSAPSSLGRNQSNVSGKNNNRGSVPACMACDRPLRLRMTSKPLGRIQASIEKQLQKLPVNEKNKQLLKVKTDDIKRQQASDNNGTLKISASSPTLRSRPQSAAPFSSNLVNVNSVEDRFNDTGLDNPYLSKTTSMIPSNVASFNDTASIIKPTRPSSAAILRLRHALVDNPSTDPSPVKKHSSIADPSSPPYVLKGGFKMSTGAASQQELLAKHLANNFEQEASISMPHEIGQTARSPSGLTTDKFNPIGKGTFSNGLGKSESASGLLDSRKLQGQTSIS